MQFASSHQAVRFHHLRARRMINELPCTFLTLLSSIIAGNHDLSLDNCHGWYDGNYKRWHREKEVRQILCVSELTISIRSSQDTAFIRQNILTGTSCKAANLIYLEDEKIEFSTKPQGRIWSAYGSPVSIVIRSPRRS